MNGWYRSVKRRGIQWYKSHLRDPSTSITVEHITVPEVRYDWIPRVVGIPGYRSSDDPKSSFLIRPSGAASPEDGSGSTMDPGGVDRGLTVNRKTVPRAVGC